MRPDGIEACRRGGKGGKRKKHARRERERERETNERENENRIKIVAERNPHFSFQPGRLDASRSDNQT